MTNKQSALIIANSRYEDSALRQLLAPIRDAEDLARVLQDPAIGNFDVTTVLDQPSYKIKQQIQVFFSSRRREDLLLLYFSGHGIKDEDGKLYFAAADTQQKLLQATGIEASFINEMMRKSMSRQQILLLDCCHSGAFARGMVAKAGTPVGTWENLGGRGRVVLTASDSMQYSFEGNAGIEKASMSIFTGTLVHGLTSGEADLDGDGLVSLDELYTYVHDKIRDLTPNQTPTKWELDVEGKIIIARAPASHILSAKLPDDVREAIASKFPSVREDAIHELDRLLRGKHKGLARAAEEALRELTKDDSRRVSNAAEICLRNLTREQANLSSRPALPPPEAGSQVSEASSTQQKEVFVTRPPGETEFIQQQAGASSQGQTQPAPATSSRRPLSVLRLLGRTFKLYFGNFSLFTGVAAAIPLLTTPLYLLQYLIWDGLFNSSQRFASATVFFTLVAAYACVFLAGGALAAAGTTNAVSMVMGNQKRTALGSLKSLGTRVWRWLAGYLLLVLVASSIVLILLYPVNKAIGNLYIGIALSLAVLTGTIFLLTRTMLCASVFAMERVTVFESIRRSLFLSRGAARWIWLFSFLVFLLNWLLTLLVFIPVMNGSHLSDTTGVLLMALAWSFCAAITSPFITIPVALIYFDQRSRKEGVSPEGLLQFLDQTRPSESAAVGA